MRTKLTNRFFILAIFCLPFHILPAQPQFRRGVNLTQWFQVNSAQQIQFTRFTKKDFENIKSLGCDVVRLPTNLHDMTTGASDYTLDPLLFSFLDEIVEWSEELGVYLILDNHSYLSIDTPVDSDEILVKIWSQIANHYSGKSPFILYEILNEPHGIADATWANIQQLVINAIRDYDSDHYIVVGGTNYNSYTTLQNLPTYTDDKLIYTFHFYDPFLFTHQGASWVSPSLEALANIPFPYTTAGMPPLPSQFNGTWIQSAYNNYAIDGTLARVKQLIDMAVSFKTSRNVPVYCGEFGVFTPNSDPAERVAWYDEVRKYLDEQDIPWTIWDYTGDFGVFEAGSNELFEHDLNVPMLQALDFNVPPQTNFFIQPKTSSLIIYDDYPASGIITSSYGGTSTITYYDTNDPQNGMHAIQWNDGELYETISFDFRPDVNLSLLPSHDYYLNFWVRSNSPGLSFDIRFVDTKTGSNDHPWRMGKTINETITTWNGEWQLVSIPLDEMEEKGSWDNGWYPPEGNFSWSAVDRLEIVAENIPLNDVDIFFDNIQITGPEIEIVTEVEVNATSNSIRAYPNPVEGHCLVEYSTQTEHQITVTILDQFGRPLRHLFEGVVPPGTHIWTWYGDNDLKNRVANGVYIAVIQDDKTIHTLRLTVLH